VSMKLRGALAEDAPRTAAVVRILRSFAVFAAQDDTADDTALINPPSSPCRFPLSHFSRASSQQRLRIFDVRSEAEYDAFHLPRAESTPIASGTPFPCRIDVRLYGPFGSRGACWFCKQVTRRVSPSVSEGSVWAGGTRHPIRRA
jgi:rhodanese-related sulfurtransferase